MTTLYKPVLIESAEQAEALPIGTVAVNPQDRTEASVRVQNGWHVTGVGKMDGTPSLFKHRDMVGDLALVPIEAEEHEDEEYGILSDRYSPPDVIPAVGWQTLTPADRQYRRTVYTTPWEEA